MMILVIVVQALVPELLMTSAGITFVCLGLFATFNNPAKEYREQVYWDAAAGILNENMQHAHDVYRVGGDEFVAIYISPKDEVVKEDIAKVRKACEEYKDSPIILSIAMGYAAGEYSPEYMEIYNQADEEMYQNKAEIKKQHPELCGR